MNRPRALPGKAGLIQASKGVGIVTAGTGAGWAFYSGQPTLAILLTATLAILGALGAAANAIMPQNSRDRVEWLRVLLNYRLHSRRDRAAARLAPQSRVLWLGLATARRHRPAPQTGGTTADGSARRRPGTHHTSDLAGGSPTN